MLFSLRLELFEQRAHCTVPLFFKHTSYFPEFMNARICIWLKSHFLKNLYFLVLTFWPKLYFPENFFLKFTLVRKYIWKKIFFPKSLFSRNLFFQKIYFLKTLFHSKKYVVFLLFPSSKQSKLEQTFSCNKLT